ncbi:hypothetical protein KC207_00115 [Phycicoccus sp. BSK3Z-2]|uniref:Mandelate racemase/muconate lactonizing enzyme C-terminal domain-containing protein n=1 Tax=Phycicoccus avicenniae TaxID=2828860 RepID=A0A941HXC4_9MICO|nr:enolase C-terminal domain-like protein [Phycicoccus avicenniae]MBR7741698.1 hypothetical protein [Phycicoccus avicenniae]
MNPPNESTWSPDPVVDVRVVEVSGPAPADPQPFTRSAVLTSRYVEVETAAGIRGLYGPIDPETVEPVLRQLGPLLLGRDSGALGDLWHLLAGSDRHAHVGHLRMALSALDNVLWDVRGKALGLPVWRLLGGGSRTAVPVYVSTLGSDLEAEAAVRTGLELRAEGYPAQKWFPRDGDTAGEEGLRRNVRLAHALREALGDEADVMFDAGGAWSLGYATAWEQQVRSARPTWLEEPFRPTHLASYRELRRRSQVPLTAGEHLYGTADTLPYLTEGLVSVMQADPEWCGGVSELLRICTLAAAFGIPVMPHGHGLHAALHVVASRPATEAPRAEYLLHVMRDRHHFERDAPTPVDGRIALTEAPGFGIRLADERVTARATRSARD